MEKPGLAPGFFFIAAPSRESRRQSKSVTALEWQGFRLIVRRVLTAKRAKTGSEPQLLRQPLWIAASLRSSQ
jgi:hypothetical protein